MVHARFGIVGGRRVNRMAIALRVLAPAVLLAAVPRTAVAQSEPTAPEAPVNATSLPGPAIPELPQPTYDPLRIDFARDPVLRLSETSVSLDEFRAVLASALARHPSRFEAAASVDEAQWALYEARERQYPSGEVTISSYKTIAREFSNDPFNIIERSRPTERTDALLSVQQTLLDFGATQRRIAAAGARLRAASAEQEYVADQLALRAIASWYDVFAYQALTEVAREFTRMQESFRGAMDERISQGVSAESDIVRVETYIATANARVAQLERTVAQAAARYEELTGMPPAASQPRAPQLGIAEPTKEDAILAARERPQVRAAEAEAAAARQDYRAAKAELLPVVTAGVDAGRYGVLENDRDYDVRARVTMRQQFFGGAGPRAEQFGARAREVEARAQRIREEAERDASIAWSDVQALAAQLASQRESYIASRRARDILFERFKAARGSLFDVLEANEEYFESALAYVRALSELDAARYVLLSRTGKLLPALDIEPPPLAGTR